MTASGQDPVVVTGLGLVLPCGDGIAAARASRASRKPCFTDLPPALGRGLGGVCTAFSPAGIIPPMALRRLDRPSRYAWVATHQAFADAGLDPRPEGDRIGIVVGSSTAGNEAGEAFIGPYFERGPEGASPMVFPNCVANAASGHLSIAFGLRGPCATLVDRENATLLALEQGCRWLQTGQAERVLLLGADGLFPLQLQLLRHVRRLAAAPPEAGAGSGMLAGEGAQAFLLELASGAAARGARVRARLAGFAESAGPSESRAHRREALARAVAALDGPRPDRWIGGASGLPTLDDVELPLRDLHPSWPELELPKLWWGEFAGSGGQLLAAALLEPAATVLVTAPACAGPQVALRVEDVVTG